VRGAVPATLAVALLVFLISSPLAPTSALASSAQAKAQAKAKARPSCAYANLRPTAANTALVDSATLCLIDQVRAAYRLQPLRSNRELRVVARKQTLGMVHDDYFGDNGPSGQTSGALIAALPYGARASSLATAQNLGWGTRSAATPARIVAAWMRSPPHREVILTGVFRDAGAGVAPAVPSILGHGAGGATYAVEFAARGIAG
jgi:uncharacterized protein YkwD